MEFNDIVKTVKQSLSNENKDVLLYAFNATGKTRLSNEFDIDLNDSGKLETLCYNSIIEDYFSWNNEDKILQLNKNCWLYKFIEDEGLDSDIINTFKELINVKIEPFINFDSGEINFTMVAGDERTNNNIKISKGEETLFKWTTFYVVVKNALEVLKDKKEDRSTDMFDNLKYIIIDDPVSSLDDYKIYTLSMQIIELMKQVHQFNNKVQFLITTHHILFYNIIYNTMKNRSDKSCFYMLTSDNQQYELKPLRNDEPLVYHLSVLNLIKQACEGNELYKFHFNSFRSVLEKMTIFLGFTQWYDLFSDYSQKEELFKIINMNSHEKYADQEIKYLTEEQKNIFINGFEFFIKKYKFNI